MGVDFIALLKHRLDIPAVRALSVALGPEAAPKLARATEALGQIRPPARSPATGPLLWRIDEANMISADPGEVWSGGSPFALVGPLNLHLDIGPVTCLVSDGTRWGIFLGDRQIQLALRRFCYELACILSSPSAIYAPDDAGVVVWEGVPYERIPARLSEWYGPPAATLAVVTTVRTPALTTGQIPTGGSFFIDKFADLAPNAHHKE